MSAAADLERKVHAKIDELEDELIKVALDLSDVDAALPVREGEEPKKTGVGDVKYHERRGAEYVESWLTKNGFETKRQGAPDRFNVLGTYRGTGRGRSILFCSHLDVGIREGINWRHRYPDASHRISAWRDADSLVGVGVANCKGPMSCWMISTKAIKDSGIQLPGDVLLSSVVGETGGSPVDEFESPKWDSHELGARYVASHGGLADYVVVAEATAFSVVTAMTGFVYFKVTIFGRPSTYTAFLRRPEASRESSVNAIVRTAKFIDRFEDYADRFYDESKYTFDGVTMTPNGTLGAIRAGLPPSPHGSPELCSLYIDFRVSPGMDPLNIQRDLEGILADMGTEGTVEIYKFLPGYEAWRNKGFETLNKAVVDAHTGIFNEPPGPVASQFVSMWRDLNPYNEIGVPAISYGFPTGYTQHGASVTMATAQHSAVKIADMIKAAKIYASMTLDLCSRPASDPL